MRNSATTIWIQKGDIFKAHIRNYWEPQQQKEAEIGLLEFCKATEPFPKSMYKRPTAVDICGLGCLSSGGLLFFILTVPVI